MKTIVLVGCGKDKLQREAKAKDLYTGELFRRARAYAERNGDSWWILSARHCLLDPEEVIKPYDDKLPIRGKELHWWKLNVRNAISCGLLEWTNETPDNHVNPSFSCKPVRFVALAGEPYLCWWDLQDNEAMRKYCILEKPLAGLGIGERLKFLGPVGGPCARSDARPGESVPGRAGSIPQGQATFWR